MYMFFLIFVLFFSSNLSAGLHSVSVQKRTAASGLLALSYFSYKYGPKVVAKKLPFILPALGFLAGLQNNSERCALISSGMFGMSLGNVFSRDGTIKSTIKSLFTDKSTIKSTIKSLFTDKSTIKSTIKSLFTKRRLFQFFCCALLIGGGYKFFDDYRDYRFEFSSIFSSLIVTDALKYVLKKYSCFNKIPHSLLLSLMAYLPILFFFEISNNLFFNYSEIKRPSWYDEAVSLKTKRTRCFYFPREGRDHTATLCGSLNAERVFNLDQLDLNSMKNIIGIIIMAFSDKEASLYEQDNRIEIDTDKLEKLGPLIKTIFDTKEELSLGDNWYWDDNGVQFSKKRFEMVAKLYFEHQELYADIDSERFAQVISIPYYNTIENQIEEWANKEVISGRVFDQEVSFDKVLELINYMFLEKKFVKDDFQYIFSKDIDMGWKRVLEKEFLDNNDLRYIAINMLYGIFCDTCAINFKNNINIFKHVRSWCFGCGDHIGKGFVYGPMTVLEHMLLDVKNKSRRGDEKMKNLRPKLIELGIVKRSFFASIQL